MKKKGKREGYSRWKIVRRSSPKLKDEERKARGEKEEDAPQGARFIFCYLGGMFLVIMLGQCLSFFGSPFKHCLFSHVLGHFFSLFFLYFQNIYYA